MRGRYKSILVDADTYLLQLVRYIHRNPLETGLVKELNRHIWSSHQGYLSDAKKWNWLHKDFILSVLTKDKKQQREVYRKFIVMDNSNEITQLFEREKTPSVLGSEKFIGWVKDIFFHQKDHIEVPESKSLAPDKEKIKQIVCNTYHVEKGHLLKSKRGTFNEPRNVAIYLSRTLRGEGLHEICREYQLKKYSSASSVIERVRDQMSNDQQFRRRVEQLRLMLIKSQTET